VKIISEAGMFFGKCMLAIGTNLVHKETNKRITMHPSKIPAKVLTELNRQFNQELSAAHSYRALSIWCEAQNLTGFAGYFAKQAAEEHVHAEKISAHIIDRDAMPKTTAIAAPKYDFKSLLEVASHAQAMEQSNTQGINSVYEAALGARDYPAQVLMQWFINEQVEEEAWCFEMVERVQAATCAGALSDLDRHIERYLTGDKGEK
jgi:ferritin